MAVIAPSCASFYSDAENLEAVLFHLRQQGMESSEQYLEDAEFIFLDRGSLEDPRFPGGKGSAYDVVVRFPTWRKIPPYLYREMVSAMRRTSLRTEVFCTVQFQVYDDWLECNNTTHTDMLVEELPGSTIASSRRRARSLTMSCASGLVARLPSTRS